MRLHRWLQALAVGCILAAATPALAQDEGTGGTGTTPAETAPAPTTTTQETTTTTTTTTTTADVRAMNLPVATPIGKGWYGAGSTMGENGWMATAAPWSNDLTPIRGAGRVAAIGSGPIPGGMAPTAAAQEGVTPRFIAGAAQWTVPAENATYEVRLAGTDPNAPFGGAGIMRVEYGDTGIDAPQFPRALSYVALYGPADVYRNGKRVATGLHGHIMVTQGIRTPDTGQLLDTPNVNPQAIEYHVLVQGNIPGRRENSLYAFWPAATLDLRNLSAPVALLPSEIRLAQSYFTPTEAVAGTRESLTVPVLMISLQDRFLARSTPTLPAGEVELRVVNNASKPQGLYIKGPGIEQRTERLKPGEETTLRLRLQPGTYRLAAFTVANPRRTRDYMHWDSVTAQ